MDRSFLTTPKHWSGRGSRRNFLGFAAGIGAAGLAGGILPFTNSFARASGIVSPVAIPNAAQSGYAWVANHGLDGDSYQAEFESLAAQGYRLIKLSGYSVYGQDFYASIWDMSPGPAWAGMHRVPGADYQAHFDSLTSQGLRPVDISGYEMNGSDYYTAIFEQSEAPGGWSAAHGVSGADYQALFDSNVTSGLMPLRVSGYTIGGADYYASIWIGWDGRGWSAVHGLDDASYRAHWDTPGVQGKRLVDISGYEIGGTARYTAIWDDTPKAYWITNHDLSPDSYQSQFDENTAAGYAPIHVAGYGVAGQARYAGIWAAATQPTGGTIGIEAIDQIANDALAASGVPGMSVAIAKNGMLVYAKGYGMAKASTGEAMTVKHRLRIASVSKSFTGAAIVQLQEQGILSFDDKVLGSNGWLGNTYGALSYSTNQLAITIDDLLHHTVDGWDDSSRSWMNEYPEKTRDELISWMMDNVTVVSTGTVSKYSNFCYCLLGRIIEVATGQTYESYLQNNLLAQCGITSMQIAGDTLAERASNEVVYDGGGAYPIMLRRGDSNGGWMATPTDLLRFMVRFDDLPTPPDVISATSLTGMRTGTTASPGYGRGFGIGGINIWGHNGGFAGTEAILNRLADGTCYAVLSNGNSNANMDAFNVDTIGLQMSTATIEWPTGTPL